MKRLAAASDGIAAGRAGRRSSTSSAMASRSAWALAARGEIPEALQA